MRNLVSKRECNKGLAEKIISEKRNRELNGCSTRPGINYQ